MLNITETYCQMGKISNNLETHGEKEVTAFDIPISGITLTSEEVNALLEDPYADRWLFNTAKDVRESNVAKFEPLTLVDSYKDATVSLTMSTGALFTFQKSQISSVTLEPKRGGETIAGFKLRIRPENDQQILELLEHQNHQVRIDVADAKVQLKGGRNQQELPLNRAGADEKGDDAGGDDDSKELTHPEQLFNKGGKGASKKRASRKQASH